VCGINLTNSIVVLPVLHYSPIRYSSAIPPTNNRSRCFVLVTQGLRVVRAERCIRFGQKIAGRKIRCPITWQNDPIYRRRFPGTGFWSVRQCHYSWGSVCDTARLVSRSVRRSLHLFCLSRSRPWEVGCGGGWRRESSCTTLRSWWTRISSVSAIFKYLQTVQYAGEVSS